MKTIAGLEPLSVGTVYCIGRNYARHAGELGNAVPDTPMVFLKPAGSIIGDGGTIMLPPQSREVHHEVELVLAIGQGGRHIDRKDAAGHIAGYGLGIDVTARDIQSRAKAQGHPWSLAKGFHTFAPLSPFKPFTPDTDLSAMTLTLTVNGQQRQAGNTADMIFPPEALVAYLSTVFELQAGDLIFTGTPAGVSAIEAGDRIEAQLNENEISLHLSVKRHD